MAKESLVDGFDFSHFEELDFCESCIDGKHHRSNFPKAGLHRAKEPLELIHSDVGGKMSIPSLSGALYFVTFIDDYTRYTWLYVLKHKSEVFSVFKEWKAFVKKSSGHRVRKIRSDNGGEYVSNEFEEYLKREGVKHELTVPKNPEQNGVSERMNRTLVESVRSMLNYQRNFGLKHCQQLRTCVIGVPQRN